MAAGKIREGAFDLLKYVIFHFMFLKVAAYVFIIQYMVTCDCSYRFIDYFTEFMVYEVTSSCGYPYGRREILNTCPKLNLLLQQTGSAEGAQGRLWDQAQ